MVYILHFSRAFHHARHYVGFTEKPEQRLGEHAKGSAKSSKLMQAVIKAGITFTVARVFPDADRHFERKIKNSHRTARFCPICSGEAVNEA